jgi:hypothetical protein
MRNGRCQNHGGKSLIGPASGTYKHGRYSKLLPNGLRETYEASLVDEQLLSLNDELSLIHVRVADLVRQLDDRGSVGIWRDLCAAWRDLKSAMQGGDRDALAAALGACGSLIDKGAADETVWAEIVRLVKDKSSIATAESRRQIELGTILTAAQATTWFSAVAHAVVSEVADRATLARIGRRLGELLPPRPTAAPVGLDFTDGDGGAVIDAVCPLGGSGVG